MMLCSLLMITLSSFVFSIIFMILTMVTFVSGAVTERYLCQPFSINNGTFTGVEFLEDNIPELQFTISDKTVKISELLYQCERNQPITKAANLTDLIEKFVDKDTILQQVDDQMSVINSTYDQIVGNLGLAAHIQKLADYQTPSELESAKSELAKGKGEVDAIIESLGTISNANDPDQVEIKLKATQLATLFDDLLSSAELLVKNAEQLKPADIAPDLQSFSDSLTRPESPVKEAIYSEAKFLRANIFVFVNQITEHVESKLGQCQASTTVLEPLTSLLFSRFIRRMTTL